MEPFKMTIHDIHDYQQNRYPFLFMDAVEEVVPGECIKGYKNLTINDWFFKTHFPGRPTMPGVLQVEALIQIGALTVLTLDGNKGRVVYATSINNVRFLKEVIPGDRFDMEVILKSWRRGLGICAGKAHVNGELVCMADFTITIPEILREISNQLPGRQTA